MLSIRKISKNIGKSRKVGAKYRYDFYDENSNINIEVRRTMAIKNKKRDKTRRSRKADPSTKPSPNSLLVIGDPHSDPEHPCNLEIAELIGKLVAQTSLSLVWCAGDIISLVAGCTISDQRDEKGKLLAFHSWAGAANENWWRGICYLTNLDGKGGYDLSCIGLSSLRKMFG